MVKVKDLASYLHTLLLTKPVPVLTTPVHMGVVLHKIRITLTATSTARITLLLTNGVVRTLTNEGGSSLSNQSEPREVA